MNKSLIHEFAFLVVLMLFAAGASAQTLGTLKGTLTDDTGSLIPGATVTVTGAGGVKKTAGTDADGVYSVSGLRPGTYMVHATSAGFAAADKKVEFGTGAVKLTPSVILAPAPALAGVPVKLTVPVAGS